MNIHIVVLDTRCHSELVSESLVLLGPVAQWIEQFRPKEEVVRSTRTRITKHKK